MLHCVPQQILLGICLTMLPGIKSTCGECHKFFQLTRPIVSSSPQGPQQEAASSCRCQQPACERIEVRQVEPNLVTKVLPVEQYSITHSHAGLRLLCWNCIFHCVRLCCALVVSILGVSMVLRHQCKLMLLGVGCH